MKKIKRLVAAFLVMALAITAVPVTSVQADDATSITVYVTVSDAGTFERAKTGEEMVRKEVTLTGESSYTLVDVFEAVHETYYVGGKDGCAYEDAYGYGNGVSKIWGETTSSVGYYVNDAMVMNLDEAVVNGADVDFFLYDDSGNYEGYTWFTSKTATVAAGSALTLTLNQYSYDSSWNLVPGTVSDATITIAGTETSVKTAADGTATVTFPEAGTYVVSATKTNTDGSTAITAPYCVVTVTGTTATVTDTATATVSKTSQTIKVKKLTKTFKASKLKKKARTFKLTATAKTKVTFEKVSGSKYITVSSKGKVKVKKGTKAGTYRVKVKVVAKESDTYNKAVSVKTVTVTVK